MNGENASLRQSAEGRVRDYKGRGEKGDVSDGREDGCNEEVE